MASLEQVLKSLLKVGLKTATPILGDIVTTALEGGGGLLLDNEADARARDVHARILRAARAPRWGAGSGRQPRPGAPRLPFCRQSRKS